MAALHARSFTVPRPYTESEFAGFLADAASFIVAEPQGFVLGRVAAGEAELLTLAVAPDARQRGIGRRLLDAFEARAQARGAARAILEVGAGNRAARALYARAGYRQAGCRPGYYRHPDGRAEDALLLEKRLARD